MKTSNLNRTVLGLLLLLTPAASAQSADPLEDQALVELIKLGFHAQVDAKLPGKPVIGLTPDSATAADVTDKDLARVEWFTDLRQLDLHGTAVTDAGLEHLWKLKALRDVDLRGTKVTAAGIASLKGKLPNLTVLEGPVATAGDPIGGTVPGTSPSLPPIPQVGLEDAGARDKTPDGAIVLFDGKDLSKWQAQGGGKPGFIVNDGNAEAHDRDIETIDKYRDFKLHLEFDPEPADPQSTGLRRGNSGVYLQGRYEIQVLDSYHQKLDTGACASVYRQRAPDKNMAKPLGQWQSYDIEFHAAKFAGDKKVAPARVTVIWNGEKVLDNVDVKGPTDDGDAETAEPGAVRLQYHDNPVRFRTIWIVPLEEK